MKKDKGTRKVIAGLIAERDTWKAEVARRERATVDLLQKLRKEIERLERHPLRTFVRRSESGRELHFGWEHCISRDAVAMSRGGPAEVAEIAAQAAADAIRHQILEEFGYRARLEVRS